MTRTNSGRATNHIRSSSYNHVKDMELVEENIEMGDVG